MNKYLITTISISISACADMPNPNGWGNLPTKEPMVAVITKTTSDIIQAKCPDKNRTIACAIRYSDTKKCIVYVSEYPKAYEINHELFHCAGYEHP